MTRLEELEKAIESLPEEDYNRFRDWFLERDWELWDMQIEEDCAAGRLDFMIQEALEEKKAGKTTPIDLNRL